MAPALAAGIADAGMDRVRAAWSDSLGVWPTGVLRVIRRECLALLGELRLLACPALSAQGWTIWPVVRGSPGHSKPVLRIAP